MELARRGAPLDQLWALDVKVRTRTRHLKLGVNPAETICNRAQTTMHHLVSLVIAVFMLMYLGLALVRFS
jgi:hypothetical protein